MKETVIEDSGGTRVVRLGAVRVDYRVEKLVRNCLELLVMGGGVSRGARERAAGILRQAEELGWRRDEKGQWVR